jgi:PEGA domain
VLGRLVVNVTPGTASLRFVRDGVSVVAPVERGGYRLQVGKYQVYASAPGYTSSEAQVVVPEEAPAELDVALVPLPRATGLLLVNAHGVAADVYIDGTRVAVTPATLGAVRVGPHTLELRAQGKAERRSITIVEGKPTYVEVSIGGTVP